MIRITVQAPVREAEHHTIGGTVRDFELLTEAAVGEFVFIGKKWGSRMLRLSDIEAVEPLEPLASATITEAAVRELCQQHGTRSAQEHQAEADERDACPDGTEVVIGPGVDGSRHRYFFPQPFEHVLDGVLASYESWLEDRHGHRIRILRDLVEVLRPIEPGTMHPSHGRSA